ncbi:MAG: site-2 protease family protein [Burkholderiales bacterium]|jgi:Zn-dependent protease|nr:MAG: site-2 protease family protein [Burkholderiales bacterium]
MEGLIQTITVYAIPVLFAITVHEAAHGYVARHFGDNTAYVAGRVTLNPLKHIDPLGTILVPLLMVTLSGFMFGWAKPVPVNFGHLRNPKRDMIWVAAAGPGANLSMAVLWLLFAKVMVLLGIQEHFFLMVAGAGINVNLMLMALNLLPLPPLDGGRILVGVLPRPLAWQVARVEPYGFVILLLLLFTNTLGFFVRPFLQFGRSVLELFI